MKRRSNITSFLSVAVMLFAIISLMLVKAFHTHEHNECHAETTSTESISHNCEICDFTLSPFVDVEAPSLTAIVLPCDNRIFIPTREAASIPTPAILLRGPPTV